MTSGAPPRTGTASEAGLRVLLVEDDPLIREILAVALKGMGYEVQAEPDGARIDRVAMTFRPDIALIDMHLGDGVDGLTVARRLRAVDSIPFLFLTGDGAIESVLAGFEVGGEDYLVKPFVMAELQARIRAVLRRGGRKDRTVREVADLVLDQDAHTATRAGHPLDLTAREFSLLATFCSHPGIVLSKVQLLTQVWGFEHYDHNVVEVHVSALRRKLEEHGPRVIHTIRNVGYVLRPPAATAGDPDLTTPETQDS
jgi:two-component system OmpR family response regulator